MHIPVLLQEVVASLSVKPGEFVIDGTLGAGGHTKEILRRIAPGGVLLAVDRDPRAVAAFTNAYEVRSEVRLITESASYARLPELLKLYNLPLADALLLDLGFSSEQIVGGALAGRGLSFSVDEPLLMTYDDSTPSAASRLAELSERELAEILKEYGEERYARQIARSIVERAEREGIATTRQLVAAIEAAVPSSYERGRLHPATRTFQALRIYVNGELRELEQLLEQLPKIVRRGGRVVIISFHSLEDRVVKNYFKKYRSMDSRQGRDGGGRSVGASRDGGRAQAGELPNSTPASTMTSQGGPVPGSKKPVTATEAEIAANPRSRSAKLRTLILP